MKTKKIISISAKKSMFLIVAFLLTSSFQMVKSMTPVNIPNPNGVDTKQEGSHFSHTISVGSANRKMILYVPTNLPEKAPLLISCHGYNQDDAYQAGQAAYWMVADTAKFLTVYPNGINKAWDTGGNSDLDFMSTIIDSMYNRYKIDKERVYLSGFSMGAMFTYHVANKMADKIAAVAPTMGWHRSMTTASNSRPIPIVQVIGTEDPVFTDDLYQTEFWNIFNAFVAKNECIKQGRPATYPQGSKTSGAKKTLWRNPENGIEMVLFTTPKGHWHSNDPLHLMSNLEIWNFCKRYSLKGLIGYDTSAVPEITPEAPAIVSEEYFNMLGQKIQNTTNIFGAGKYVIKRTLLANGAIRSTKVFVE